jgi:hypothetical protein
MKNLSIPIEHKNEAIRLFEKLGYVEHKEWNEQAKEKEYAITHILMYKEGIWELHSHDGTDYHTPITIEELRELAVQSTIEPTPDKLDLLIQQMRELRAELREFMKEEKPAEAQKWKVGNRVRITKEASQQLKECEVVELIKYRKDNDICPWLAKSELGIEVWISESEAELI